VLRFLWYLKTENSKKKFLFAKSSTYAGIGINLGQKSKIGLMESLADGESFSKSYSLLSSVPYPIA
jgi:hypothetical protein